MTTKEKTDMIIKEWEWLLEGLPKAKYKRYRYARIYDKILKNNNHDTAKLLLPIAYKVFNEIGDVKTTKSNKNFIPISPYETTTLVGKDAIENYVKAIAMLVVERLQSGMNFGYLYIRNEELGIVN